MGKIKLFFIISIKICLKHMLKERMDTGVNHQIKPVLFPANLTKLTALPGGLQVF